METMILTTYSKKLNKVVQQEFILKGVNTRDFSHEMKRRLVLNIIDNVIKYDTIRL